MSATAEPHRDLRSVVEKLSLEERWKIGRDSIRDGEAYVDDETGMHMGPNFLRALYDNPKVFEAYERMLEDQVAEGRDRNGTIAMELRDHAVAKTLRRAFNPDPEIPRDVQAAKRATLPPPPKHGRQRAPVDRGAFVTKRDARRRMAKASRRGRR